MRDPRNIDVLLRESPNQSPYTWGEEGIRRIVTHTPQGSWEGTLSTIMNPANKVSYHELLHPSGKRAMQFVKWSRKAWHAGDPDTAATEGVSACCFADQLTAEVEGLMAKTVAWRLIVRGLPCVYNPSRDPLAYRVLSSR